ncbi:MAG: ribosome small subunit-dependent GTPase A [Sphingobacteriales bacterium]|nr:MAG: ribosome small subunit-dependent GTPase A [Sphingobacteriales bacterium]
MKARIYKSTGSHYQAMDENGRMWVARARGKFKIDVEIKSSNPIAVGDWVTLMIEDDAASMSTITAIAPRRNYMVRVSPQNRHHKHIVASNLDEALVVATIHSPRTSNGFLDRFLITAEAYHIPAIIVFNKADLIQGEYEAEWEYRKSLYENIGYKTFTIQATDPASVAQLSRHLQGKTTLISGHSGVGKSTLINALLPDLGLKVQSLSDWSGKGQHTTTFAQMYDMDQSSQIIDTPGVKEFGIVAIDQYELAQYFPEMRALMHDCKFNNCLHINEPQCAVKESLGEAVSFERYDSYLNILDSLPKTNY